LNKVTGDITEMAAQVPALFEALSGMHMSDLLGKIRTIGDKSARPEALKTGTNGSTTTDAGADK
jgi:flotillin